MPENLISPALVGELVLLALLLMVVWLVFREMARLVVKVAIPLALVLGIAIWAGFLDATVVGNVLTSVGESLLTGLKALAEWIASVAFS